MLDFLLGIIRKNNSIIIFLIFHFLPNNKITNSEAQLEKKNKLSKLLFLRRVLLETDWLL